MLGTNAFAEKKESTTVEQEWYMRLIAEVPSEQMRDRGNVLGQLYDSSAGKDSHDLIELAPFGEIYLTIVFPHPEWGDDAGDYSSDYHHPDAYNEDEWIFQVKTSATNSDVTLRWEGLNVVSTSWGGKKPKKKEELVIDSFLERMWVEDTATGEKMPVVVDGKLQTYTFNMNGSNVREFRWGIGTYTKHVPSAVIETKKPVELIESVKPGKLGKPGKPIK
ncbi:hypothetical protein ACLHDG_00840 [Sulfurovum sp. CS9]|uniref:hypothetical protein n=1 Tax=Sulfurovum sp. CS9 TaxID=3391146 RepID=UPI0039EB3F42